jgi:sugar/nucleoside kinase (ribokinase family)
MTDRARRIVALGDLVLDLITEARLPILPGQHQETPPIRPEPGGGCNFLIAGAHLGAQMSAVGAVGADMFGQVLIDVLREEGVDTSAVFRAPASTTAVIYDLIDPATRLHTFIGGYATGDVMPFDDAARGQIMLADAVFLQGYTLLERQLPTMVDAALACARQHDTPCYFDVGPPSRAVPTARLRAVLAQMSCVMLTEDELPIIAPDLDEDAAVASLFALGVGTVVLKRGGRGCSVFTPDNRIAAPGLAVNVVDTVGAGDCFNAAFIYARCLGMPLERAAELANGMGAACVQKVAAGRNAPTRTEITAVLSAHGYHWSF